MNEPDTVVCQRWMAISGSSYTESNACLRSAKPEVLEAILKGQGPFEQSFVKKVNTMYLSNPAHRKAAWETAALDYDQGLHNMAVLNEMLSAVPDMHYRTMLEFEMNDRRDSRNIVFDIIDLIAYMCGKQNLKR